MKIPAIPLLLALAAVSSFAGTASSDENAHAAQGIQMLRRNIADPATLVISRAVVSHKTVCIEYERKGRFSTGNAVYRADQNLVWVDNLWVWHRDCVVGKIGQLRGGSDVTEAANAALTTSLSPPAAHVAIAKHKPKPAPSRLSSSSAAASEVAEIQQPAPSPAPIVVQPQPEAGAAGPAILAQPPAAPVALVTAPPAQPISPKKPKDAPAAVAVAIPAPQPLVAITSPAPAAVAVAAPAPAPVSPAPASAAVPVIQAAAPAPAQNPVVAMAVAPVAPAPRASIAVAEPAVQKSSPAVMQAAPAVRLQPAAQYVTDAPAPAAIVPVESGSSVRGSVIGVEGAGLARAALSSGESLADAARRLRKARSDQNEKPLTVVP
jgi:hypothetical protein